MSKCQYGDCEEPASTPVESTSLDKEWEMCSTHAERQVEKFDDMEYK